MKKTIDEQVMNLGSNMIMGSLPSTDQQEQVQNLQETVEDNQAAVNAALGSGISLNDLMRRRKTRPMVKNNHIGRNEKCPCGSGKKYKHCCLNEGTYEGYHTV